MKQSVFVQTNEPLWAQLELWLDFQQLPRKERKKRGAEEPKLDFPADYRHICHHLALAQSRMYSPLLIERLNQLVIRGHNQLYSSHMHFWNHVVEFFLRGLPQLIRQERKLVYLSALLFFGPLISMMIAIQIQPDLVYSVIDGEQVVMAEEMYDPSNSSRFGREREADSDVMMFGFYIRNNTGIGFQTFAGGLAFGLGTLFFLIYNGLMIGAIAGHLTEIGYIETFWSFVAGHSAFELTAIVLSGAAGLKLAQALVMPGRKSRRLALLDNSQIAIQIVYAAALLFLMAAFVEAFWSSQAIIPPKVKYAVGIGLWVLVISYFVRVGREQNA
jgi:uncharacterized membrane protein SpoIIM required for sporulation